MMSWDDSSGCSDVEEGAEAAGRMGACGVLSCTPCARCPTRRAHGVHGFHPFPGGVHPMCTFEEMLRRGRTRKCTRRACPIKDDGVHAPDVREFSRIVHIACRGSCDRGTCSCHAGTCDRNTSPCHPCHTEMLRLMHVLLYSSQLRKPASVSDPQKSDPELAPEPTPTPPAPDPTSDPAPRAGAAIG